MSFARRLIAGIYGELLICIGVGILTFILVSTCSVYFLPEMPTDFYYSFFSAIIQGFVGLVAFLGAIAIFQLQNHESEMWRLADLTGPDKSLVVINAHKEVVDKNVGIEKNNYIAQMYNKANIARNDKIEPIFERMHQVHTFEWEIRDRITQFSFLSFLNVAVAIISFVSTEYLSINWGSVAVVVIVVLSFIVMGHGLKLVRRIVGYS